VFYIRSSLYVCVFLLVVVILSSAYFMIVFPTPSNISQTLSPIASSISALIAVLIGLWVAVREWQRQSEDDAKTAKSFGGAIKAWYDRRDMTRIRTELSKPLYKQLMVVSVSTAAEKNASAYTSEKSENPWDAEIRLMGLYLPLESIDQLSQSTSAWDTGLGRTEVAVLPGIAPTFFLDLATTWRNLRQIAVEVSGSTQIVRQISPDRPYLVEGAVSAIADQTQSFNKLVLDFFDEAVRIYDFLLNYDSGSSNNLSRDRLDGLLKRSQAELEYLDKVRFQLGYLNMPVKEMERILALKNLVPELQKSIKDVINRMESDYAKIHQEALEQFKKLGGDPSDMPSREPLDVRLKHWKDFVEQLRKANLLPREPPHEPPDVTASK
jgi:hypothetical protein